jgi:hypothetical protein
MSELSPQAQAVLDSTMGLAATVREAQAVAAAALRAVAEQCQIERNYHPDYPETEWVVVASDLTALADELENNG